MLKTGNRCRFKIINGYDGIPPGGDYYGYILDFDQDHGSDRYQGVLAPHMRSCVSGSEWTLFPMWCVEITIQPQEPIRGPSYEVDE